MGWFSFFEKRTALAAFGEGRGAVSERGVSDGKNPVILSPQGEGSPAVQPGILRSLALPQNDN
jgi:hypothetical protein